ncbi:hypothetical protein E8E13_001916 [Curvularia kusanoi]|uniref:Carbohydrate esterase family 5 protein n=1 Tax=Curvularia kusanoi TaxID=90978 RepID=A0A9P4WBM7_CURKU|nr:hypothetical protein E8E13_001916 [Curvularia kusanoi]
MSSIRQTLAVGATLTALAAAQVTAPKLEATCADVVIFMARGNDAPYHDGRTTPFIDATCAKFNAQGKSCDYIDIKFDVTLGGDYCAQVAEGAASGISQITAFNQKCPCTHIVVNGYSEGAHVVGDVLGGPGGCSFVNNGLDNQSAAGKAIGAALLWGNVMHTANQPYNVLDGASLQKNARSATDLGYLNRYAGVLRDYCAAGDPVCAGGSVVADHLNYFELYTDEASSWAVSKIDAAADLCPVSSSSSSVAPTTFSTATSSTAASSSVVAPSSTEVVPSSTGVSSASSTVVSPTATKEATPTAVAPTTAYPTSTSEVTPAPFPEPIGYEEACHVVYEVKYVYE